MSDWWSKKLAGEKPTPQRPNLPPVTAPIQFPQTVVQTQPQTYEQQATATQAPVESLPPDATLSDYLKSNLSKGGQATRKETMACPECGGRYVFSRGASGGMAPAPRCYECGWNGMYSQADQTTWS